MERVGVLVNGRNFEFANIRLNRSLFAVFGGKAVIIPGIFEIILLLGQPAEGPIQRCRQRRGLKSVRLIQRLLEPSRCLVGLSEVQVDVRKEQDRMNGIRGLGKRAESGLRTLTDLERLEVSPFEPEDRSLK